MGVHQILLCSSLYVLILAASHTQAFLFPMRQSKKHLTIATISSAYASCPCTILCARNKDNADAEIDISQVSDAEALLACRAYLQRKKRLGQWTQFEQRKRQAKLASLKDDSSTRSVGGPGFFWEDPSQLKHLNFDPDSILEGDALTDGDFDHINDVDGEEEEEIEPEEEEEVIWETVNGQVAVPRAKYPPKVNDEAEEEDLFGTDEFSVFDATPSPSYIRRSEAAKRTWADPEFRAKWHERRWGNSPLKRKKKQERKKMEERIRAVDPDNLLANEELAAMTEEEIAEAIRSYIISNKKRAASRKQTLQERKQGLQGPEASKPIPRDALLQSDPKALEEARRLRSERAARAYQKRLKKKEQKSRKKKTKDFAARPTDATPKGALLRIQFDLDHDKVPTVKDIKLILQPLRLAKRKDILRRILSDCFDLRGKCVPADLKNPDDSKFAFVTQCTVEQLGEFVLYKVREAP